MPFEDLTYTLALLLPMLNIMEFPPPAFFIICLVINCPTMTIIAIGSSHETIKDTSGEVSSIISPLKLMPFSIRVFLSSSSVPTLPVLYIFLASFDVNSIRLSCIST